MAECWCMPPCADCNQACTGPCMYCYPDPAGPTGTYSCQWARNEGMFCGANQLCRSGQCILSTTGEATCLRASPSCDGSAWAAAVQRARNVLQWEGGGRGRWFLQPGHVKSLASAGCCP